MKPFWGIDLTENGNNEDFNGEELLVDNPSDTLKQMHEASVVQATATVQKAKLPLAVRIIEWVCCGAAVVLLGSILRLLKSEGMAFDVVYRNTPWLFWVAGICLIAWLVLRIMEKQKAKTSLQSDESIQKLSHLEASTQSVYAQMNIPADAFDVDILCFYYKTDENGIKVWEKPMQLFSHFNCALKIFKDEEYLYIGSMEGKYGIALSSLNRIRTIAKKVRFSDWYKEVPFNAGIYKPYKMTKDQFGCIHSKPHYVLEFDHDGQLWGVYFPCYELPLFEELTGLKAE